MKKLIVLLTLTGILFASCTASKKSDLSQDLIGEPGSNNQNEPDPYALLKTKCYICHNPAAETHEALIAPPMAAVKMRYSRSYPTEREFSEAIVSWVMDPNADNALMMGAVDRFNVMPRQEFKQEEIEEIALYLFQNQLETPDWFLAQEKKMHGIGRGMRQGMP